MIKTILTGVISLCFCLSSAQSIDLPFNIGKSTINLQNGKLLDFSKQFQYSYTQNLYSFNYQNHNLTNNFELNKYNTIFDYQMSNNQKKWKLQSSQSLFSDKVHFFIVEQNKTLDTRYSITQGKSTLVWHNFQSNTQSNSLDFSSPNFHSTYDLGSHNFMCSYYQFAYNNTKNKATYVFSSYNLNAKFSSDDLFLNLKDKNSSITLNQTHNCKDITFSEHQKGLTTMFDWDFGKNKIRGISLNYSVKM